MLTILLGGVAIVAVAALVLFPEFRKGLGALGRGFAGLFVKDLAKTPEGARAVYETAISDAQDKYQKAKRAYERVAGEHDQVRVRIETLNNLIKTTETEAESLYRRGLMADAQTKSQQRAEYVSELRQKQQLMQNLAPALEQAKGIYELTELNLRKLKQEQKEVVNELQAQSLVKDIMSDIDELAGSSTAQRLINSTNEYLDDLRKENHGAMVVHSSKMSTRIAQADKNAALAESDDFMASMAAKYGKPGGTTAGSGGTATQTQPR